MTVPEREFQSWLFRTIVDREDEIKRFRKSLESVQQELVESQEAAARERGDNKRLQERLVELEARLNAAAQAEVRIRAEVSELHAQARAVQPLRTSLEMAQRQLEARQGQCKKYEEMIEKLNYQYEGNTQTKARIQELEQKLQAADKRLGEYEVTHQSDTQRLLEAMTERDQAQTTLEETKMQLSTIGQRVQTLEQEKMNLAQSLVSLEGQVRNKSQQVASVQKELDGSKARELELAAKCAAVQSQMTAMREREKKSEAAGTQMPTKGPSSEQSTTRPGSSQPPTQTSQQLVIRLPAQPSLLGSSTGGSTSTAQSAPDAQPQAGSSTSKATDTTPVPESPYQRIPLQRRQTLESFARIAVPDWATGEITFSRAELTSALGGGLQGVDGKFGTPRKVAAAHDLTGCIYPQRQTNPWLPTLPGQHGYMFLGLEGPAKDNVKFFEPTERALFIQEGKNCWRYYGLYVIQRHADNDLQREEWAQFDESFKDGKSSYSDTTLAKQLGKGYDSLVKNTPAEYRQRTAQIREEYDAGTRRVPCITLRCIGYNEQFLHDILACRPSERVASAKRKRTPKQLPDGTESPSPTRPRLQ